jgi:hypothetical protein
MDKLNEMYLHVILCVSGLIQDFKESERGDTNFISMLLIIAIVVVLAGLFLTLGKDVMATVTQKIEEFLESLG